MIPDSFIGGDEGMEGSRRKAMCLSGKDKRIIYSFMVIPLKQY